jgi:hypothetical protein
MNDRLYQKTQVATQLLRKRTEISVHRIAHAHAMSRSCMGTRSQSDVAGRPRNSTPRRAALMFAGSMAASRTIRPAAADRVVDGINNPTVSRQHEEFFARWMDVIGVIPTRLEAEQETRRATGSRIYPEDLHGDASRVDSALDERPPLNLCGRHVPLENVRIHCIVLATCILLRPPRTRKSRVWSVCRDKCNGRQMTSVLFIQSHRSLTDSGGWAN